MQSVNCCTSLTRRVRSALAQDRAVSIGMHARLHCTQGTLTLYRNRSSHWGKKNSGLTKVTNRSQLWRSPPCAVCKSLITIMDTIITMLIGSSRTALHRGFNRYALAVVHDCSDDHTLRQKLITVPLSRRKHQPTTRPFRRPTRARCSSTDSSRRACRQQTPWQPNARTRARGLRAHRAPTPRAQSSSCGSARPCSTQSTRRS